MTEGRGRAALNVPQNLVGGDAVENTWLGVKAHAAVVTLCGIWRVWRINARLGQHGKERKRRARGCAARGCVSPSPLPPAALTLPSSPSPASSIFHS